MIPLVLLTAVISSILNIVTRAQAIPKFDDWEHLRVALEDVSIHLRYAGSGPPLVLVHGSPQFSLTWRTVGPILAQNYTVIVPDTRGAGDSSLSPDGNYTALATGEDLKGVLDFLNITSTYVFSHDKGVGAAAALAAKYPSLVKRLGVSEYGLPGYGYQAAQTPASYWDMYSNWQLAFFSVADAAEFFISGKERQMVEWYFYHGSYSGPLSFPENVIDKYADSVSKPGFLRSMLGGFDNRVIAQDADFFTSTIGKSPLAMPVLGLGGEASFGGGMKAFWGNITTDLTTDVVPKAGHWLGDENPAWLASRIQQFLEEETSPPPSVDLSTLHNKVTLTVGYFGTYENEYLGTGVNL